MLDVKEVQDLAEKEVREENLKAAKERIKALIRKREQARQIVANCEREIADAYAEIGRGST